jgi:arylsulfatase
MPFPPFGGKIGTTYPGAVRLAETAAPNTKNRSHRIGIAITKGGDGVLLAEGGQSAGFVLYVKDGKPVYHYNFFEIERTSVESKVALPEGGSTVSFEFRYDGGGGGKGGEAVLFIDNKEVGKARIERTVIGRFGIDTFGVGCDTGSPVCNAYKPPFTFTGEIEKVDILLGDAGLSEEEERQMQERYHAGVNY